MVEASLHPSLFIDTTPTDRVSLLVRRDVIVDMYGRAQ